MHNFTWQKKKNIKTKIYTQLKNYIAFKKQDYTYVCTEGIAHNVYSTLKVDSIYTEDMGCLLKTQICYTL